MYFSTYSLYLTILSLILAIMSSFTSFVIGERVLNTNIGKRKILWVILGAIILGSGIFSMHFIGMIAHHLDAIFILDPFLNICIID